MFLDYYLTLKGAKLYREGFSSHIKAENYELNPMFQKSIQAFKYDKRHFISMVMVSVLIYFLYFLAGKNGNFFPQQQITLIPGIFFTIFLYVNANHLRNITLFKVVKQNPTILRGQVEQDYLYALKNGEAQILVVFIPLLVIFIFTPSYFSFGALLGLGAVYSQLRGWKKKTGR